MLDFIASKAAYREHEERVRSEVPELVYDGWVRDRQDGGRSTKVVRIVRALGNGLSSLSRQLKRGRNFALETSQPGQEHSEAAG